MTNDFLVANEPEESAAVFDARFSRCYRLLHFIACLVVGGPERADALKSSSHSGLTAGESSGITYYIK